MPIYEYECEKCHHRFEQLKAKMVRNSTEKCPECGGVAKQQLSTFGVGSGRPDTPCGSASAGCGRAKSCGGGGGGCGCPFGGE